MKLIGVAQLNHKDTKNAKKFLDYSLCLCVFVVKTRQLRKS